MQCIPRGENYEIYGKIARQSFLFQELSDEDAAYFLVLLREYWASLPED
jgi:hypothetical protein